MQTKRIITWAVAALLLACTAEAQVSVRRTPKKESKTEVKAPGKSKQGAAEKKASTTTASSGSSANNTTVAKKTTATKRTQQPSAVSASGKTLRQQAFDAYQKDVVEETPWQHIVYRELDLNKDVNASLYFPAEPQDGMTNLFRVIIDAFSKGELPAYEYLDGREVFSEKYRVKQQDIFDKFQIYYQVKPSAQRGGQDIYEVDESELNDSYIIGDRSFEGTYDFDDTNKKLTLRTPLFPLPAAYLSVVGDQMAMTFESGKLLNLIQVAGLVSNQPTVSAISELADSYDGMKTG